MNRIVAVGGGAMGSLPSETQLIDERIVAMAGKPRPNALFVPTASGDDADYCERFAQAYGTGLGCATDNLLLRRNATAPGDIVRKVRAADIVYVGGGNTLRMMGIWRRHGVDVLLREAWARGRVMSGLSAGCICWFRFGNGDSLQKTPEDTTLINVRCLDLVPALACPHYDSEAERRGGLRHMMRHTPGVGFGIENNAALVIEGEQVRVWASQPGQKAYRVYWSRGKHHEEPLAPGIVPWRLPELLKKT